MSMTSASAVGDVRRIEATQSQNGLSGGDSPYRPITVTRSYEGVVRQMADEIRSGRLTSGERMPTERELSAAFGVSRGVIREAVKVLEAIGLVEARQGSGIYVLNTVPTITHAFTLSVSPDTESVEQLFEFRRTLEVESAALAAVRRSDAQLASIMAAAEATELAVELGELDGFGPADNLFHGAVARASGNPYFEIAVATARQMQNEVVPLIADRVGSIRSAILHHRAIANAIATRDAAGAAQEMAMHIDYTREQVTQRGSMASTGAVREGAPG